MVSSLAASFVVVASGIAGDGSAALIESELSCKARLSVLETSATPTQTFFALLPIGLADDAAGKTQWSHLLEHLLLRSTDPVGLSDGTIVFNAETMAAGMHLDVHAPLADAPRAAAKLCGWLRLSAIDPAVLAREKQNALAEVDSTSANGFTHKWAAAAWCQVVRHGAKSAAVRGDVAAATPEALLEYAKSRVAIGPGLRIVAVGPMKATDVKALFERELGAPVIAADPALPKASAPPPAAPKKLATGDLAATWDLPAAHLLEWYVAPDAKPADRLAAMLVANQLTMALQSDPELQREKIVALASADVVAAEGRVLLLSASLADPTDRPVALAGFQRAIGKLGDAPMPGVSFEQYLTMVKAELSGLPDFAAQRRLLAGRPGLELLEAQMVLNLATREQQGGLALAAMSDAAKTLDAKQLAEWRTRLFTAERASRLLLTPTR